MVDWLSGWRHLVAAIIITVSGVDESEGECPDAYWDEPSRRCAYPLASALEQLQPETDAAWASDITINRTCTLWRQANGCYQHLLHQCQLNRIATQEIGMYLGRYKFISVACNLAAGSSYQQRQDHQHLVHCFLPHIKPTRICSEAFDSHFRNYVADKQYRNACRVVSTAMKCFEEIRNLIAQGCDVRAADEYQASFIQPLVDQTRDTVIATIKCTMSPPYEQYFNHTSPSSEHHRLAVSLVIALVFARWRLLL